MDRNEERDGISVTMSCLRDFLKDRGREWTLYIALVLGLAATWYLYGLPWQPVFYTVLLMTVVFAAVTLWDFLNYKRRWKELGLLQIQAREGIWNMPERCIGLERQAVALTEIWRGHYVDFMEKSLEKADADSRYYTLWAHQIKTPVAALRLLVQEEQTQRSCMEVELFKIEQYVDMALQYGRMERDGNDLVFEECGIEALVKQAVRRTSRLFIYRRIPIVLEELSGTVLTDRKWFVFVLEQLLSNAVKYTNQGRVRVYIKEAALSDDNSERELVIEDSGIGIRAEDVPRVFEWGYTGYNGRAENRSTGIGLFLCRQAMELLGQSIRLESEEGKGTRVYLGLTRRRFDMD